MPAKGIVMAQRGGGRSIITNARERKRAPVRSDTTRPETLRKRAISAERRTGAAFGTRVNDRRRERSNARASRKPGHDGTEQRLPNCVVRGPLGVRGHARGGPRARR